jgi:hypothetical protein
MHNRKARSRCYILVHMYTACIYIIIIFIIIIIIIITPDSVKNFVNVFHCSIVQCTATRLCSEHTRKSLHIVRSLPLHRAYTVWGDKKKFNNNNHKKPFEYGCLYVYICVRPRACTEENRYALRYRSSAAAAAGRPPPSQSHSTESVRYIYIGGASFILVYYIRSSHVNACTRFSL